MEGDTTLGFGAWLRLRRRTFDLTQAALARQAGCSTIALRKLEAEERRPSRDLAMRLAECLDVPPTERAAFWRFARGDLWAAPVNQAEPRTARSRAPLPAPLTPLIGRERETDAIRAHLLGAGTRLLTLIGPPGIGKTRLALEVAIQLAHALPGAGFGDGVAYVSLVSVADPALVAQTILKTLALEEGGPRPAAEQLAAALAEREMLLVVDNFEHLLAAAPVLVDLLSACPRLKVLATSRAALRVYGERVFRVPALAVPAGDDPAAAEAVAVTAHYPALALFVERARAARPDFELDRANLPAVTALCARLDGLPLAIEIVAARAGDFSAQALLDRLGGAALLHTDGRRGIPARHRTLHNAIGWSYALLSPAEQASLDWLGAFAGGFSLAAAKAVAGPEAALEEETLGVLVDHSLLQRMADSQAGGAEPRYALLATLREFARQRLADRGALAAAQRRHADYFCGLAEEAAPHMAGPDQMSWMRRLTPSLDDLRAAFEFGLSPNGARLLALRLHVALQWFWVRQGRLNEGWQWSARCLATGEAGAPPALWARLEYVAGEQAYFRGEYATALALLDDSLARFRVQANELRVSDVLGILAMACVSVGDRARAERLQEESLEIAYRWRHDWLIGVGLMNLADMHRGRGQSASVGPMQAEALAALRRAGDKMFTAMLLQNMGQVAQNLADFERAQALHREGLALFLELEDYRGLATALERLAGLAGSLGRPARAARLLGGAEVLRELVGAPVEMVDRPDHAQAIAMARAGLADEAAFATAWAVGRGLSLEELIVEAGQDAETP